MDNEQANQHKFRKGLNKSFLNLIDPQPRLTTLSRTVKDLANPFNAVMLFFFIDFDVIF
jgi:hypothetical protein